VNLFRRLPITPPVNAFNVLHSPVETTIASVANS
jgi:hypothetical protein